MKYCGIDLLSNNSLVSVVYEEDSVVAEKRLPNDLAKIIGLINPWRVELAGVVIESTFNWYPLVDGLKEAGFTVLWPTQQRSRNTTVSNTVVTK